MSETMLSADQIRTLLPGLMGLPIIAALVVRGLKGRVAHWAALVAAGVHLVLTALIVVAAIPEIQLARQVPAAVGGLNSKSSASVFRPQFVPGDSMPGGSPSYSTTWDVLPFYGTASDGHSYKIGAAQFFIGLDGINIWLVALSSLIVFPVILYSRDSIRCWEGAYYAWLFILQAGVIGVFLSFDLLLFFVCFELTLVPVFFLINGWGSSPNRRQAARTLFLFTLTGGLITLLGIAGIVLFVYASTPETNGQQQLTFSIPQLVDALQASINRPAGSETREAWLRAQPYLFVALATGFAVKIPLVPLHIWQPAAYSEASPGVTVMLSALLAKMGIFGLVRVCLPLCPDATVSIGTPVIGSLAIVGIIYGALCAFAQRDLYRLIAYSSISHLGLCVLAIVSFAPIALAGGILHMVNHGVSTGAMFLLVGMLARRYETSQIADFSGVWSRLPMLTFFAMWISLASIGLPGLNNFVSEIMMLAGIASTRNSLVSNVAFTILAATSVILSAWYMLTMVRRVFYGPVRLPPTTSAVSDLTLRERVCIAPLALLCLLLGMMPQPVIDVMSPDVSQLARVGEAAIARTQAP